MKKYPVGTKLMIENGGSGWGVITGYPVEVVDLDSLIKTEEDAKYYRFFTEGLVERTEDVFFVQVDGTIQELVEEEYWIEGEEEGEEEEFVEAVYEDLYEDGSVWAISLLSENAKVYEIKN